MCYHIRSAAYTRFFAWNGENSSSSVKVSQSDKTFGKNLKITVQKTDASHAHFKEKNNKLISDEIKYFNDNYNDKVYFNDCTIVD